MIIHSMKFIGPISKCQKQPLARFKQHQPESSQAVSLAFRYVQNGRETASFNVGGVFCCHVRKSILIVILKWGHYSALVKDSVWNAFFKKDSFLTKKALKWATFHTDIDIWAISHLKAIISCSDLYLTHKKENMLLSFTVLHVGI